MPKGISDFYRGDTQVYRLILKKEDGTPVDLTGSSVWFTIKRNVKDLDTEAIVQKKVDNHVDPSNGITEIKLEPSDTNTATPGQYVYDFQLVKPNGDVKTLLAGKVKILADVTRSTT